MTQKDFNLFIEQSIGDLPMHEQEELLRKIEYKWLPELQNRLSKTIAQKELRKCSYCHQYFSVLESKVVKEQEAVENALISIDFDFTEDDILADVVYEKEFFVCPHCRKKNLIHKCIISETNKHKRKDTIKSIP